MNYQVHYKEKLYFWTMASISAFVYGIFFFRPLVKGLLLAYKYYLSNDYDLLVFLKAYMVILSTFWGALFIYSMLFFVIGLIVTVFFIGNLRGNAIRITKNQFPELYEIVTLHVAQLQLKKVPEVYVLQGNGILNAFAMRFLKRQYVVLYSNVLEAAYQEGMDAVSFIIGHELGHIKRNHTSWLKSLFLLPAKLIPFLSSAHSRGCEYTCDNIGYHLSPKGALKGLLILAVGKELYANVNVKELVFADARLGFIGSFVELFSTHPVLVKRIQKIYELDGYALEFDHFDTFISPNVKMRPLPTGQKNTLENL